MAALAFAACSVAPGLARAQEAADDPWEGFNRDMYAVHDSVDRTVLEPVARGYRAVTPGPVRTGVRNFLRNLRSPVTFVNDLLQGEVERAGVTFVRFGVNTTLGMAGLLDPATSMGMERHDEDFGQTLAVWGVQSGPYIFVPVLGPTTLRDGAGRVIDMAFDPLTWAEGDNVGAWRGARGAATGVSAREQVIETVDDIRRDSVDPYVTIRTTYGLLRESAIANGPADVQELPEFDEINGQPGTDVSAPDENSQQLVPDDGSDSNSVLAQPHRTPTSAAKSGDEK
jgi:phospholipid-binding lipoprotein MlaA